MVPIKLSGVEIAGVELSGSQVQQILYVLVGFVSFILLILVVNFVATPKKSKTDKKLAKVEPQYEEIFEVENELFESSPYKSDPDSVLENSVELNCVFAPNPFAAHQRLASAGALTTPTTTSPDGSTRPINVAQVGTPRK